MKGNQIVTTPEKEIQASILIVRNGFSRNAETNNLTDPSGAVYLWNETKKKWAKKKLLPGGAMLTPAAPYEGATS